MTRAPEKRRLEAQQLSAGCERVHTAAHFGGEVFVGQHGASWALWLGNKKIEPQRGHFILSWSESSPILMRRMSGA
jgi:hypothetical protein